MVLLEFVVGVDLTVEGGRPGKEVDPADDLDDGVLQFCGHWSILLKDRFIICFKLALEIF
jgi:hypothetical protein